MSLVYDDSMVLAEDAALKTYLQGMTVRDLNNNQRQVKVWYGFPDMEVRQQEYPFLVIDLFDVQPSAERQHSGIAFDTTYRETLPPTTDGSVYAYEIPPVYDLYYQIAAYSRNPMHDRQIMFTILNSKFPSKYGHLTVLNHNGTSTARHMFLEGFVKRDTVEDGRRLLQSVFSVRVMSEMTPVTPLTATKQVTEVSLNPVSELPQNQQSVYEQITIIK